MGCFNGCCDKKLLKGKQSCLRQDSTRDQFFILSYLILPLARSRGLWLVLYLRANGRLSQ